MCPRGHISFALLGWPEILHPADDASGVFRSDHDLGLASEEVLQLAAELGGHSGQDKGGILLTLPLEVRLGGGILDLGGVELAAGDRCLHTDSVVFMQRM